MSEWLTTGQLIEKLNIGEEAVCQDFKSWVIKNTEEEGILWEDGSKFYISNEVIRKTKWRILPKYATFEEAMKALKNGKTVTCYSKGLIPHLVSYNLKEDGLLKGIHYERVLEGKWQIIE